jgi:putative endonuclease
MGLGSLAARLRAAWRRYRSLGRRGERAAARFLRRRGYKIVGRSESSPLGELDLIAVDGRTVVFVEVKTRRSHDAGHPAEAVGPDKQARLTRLALAYLKRHDLLDCSARFDVLAITWPETARKPQIEHIRNAFEAVGKGQMFS